MNTIAAISTAPGIGGIGIVRMSGKDTYSILNKIFKPKNQQSIEEMKGYTIKYGYIIQENEIIDEVLVSIFKAPHSYTTEDLCEINSHGGIYSVRKILELCLENGAKLAQPGEFTQRAFLNGRIDLIQAEAVIDIINSKTEKEAMSSMNQLEGGLSKEIRMIRQKLMDLMVNIEVSIDYPEYDVEEVELQKANYCLQEVKQNLKKLEKSFESGKLIKEGIKVALIGKPNVGKSSLLNAILKEDRAIVTDIEGTTRDVIEEAIQIKGIPINIIDTAGIRDTNNEVEKIGISRSLKSAQNADFIIAIFDATRDLDKEDEEILQLTQGKKGIIVLNKTDEKLIKLTEEKIRKYEKNKRIIKISAKERIGLEKIYEEIERLFQLDEIQLEYNTLITNIRHKNKISQSLKNTEIAIEVIQQKLPIDMIANYIKNILDELGEIIGETISDEIIKEIFSKFCLGK